MLLWLVLAPIVSVVGLRFDEFHGSSGLGAFRGRADASSLRSHSAVAESLENDGRIEQIIRAKFDDLLPQTLDLSRRLNLVTRLNEHPACKVVVGVDAIAVQSVEFTDTGPLKRIFPRTAEGWHGDVNLPSKSVYRSVFDVSVRCKNGSFVVGPIADGKVHAVYSKDGVMSLPLQVVDSGRANYTCLAKLSKLSVNFSEAHLQGRLLSTHLRWYSNRKWVSAYHDSVKKAVEEGAVPVIFEDKHVRAVRNDLANAVFSMALPQGGDGLFCKNRSLLPSKSRTFEALETSNTALLWQSSRRQLRPLRVRASRGGRKCSPPWCYSKRLKLQQWHRQRS